jgi:hypothetical protein
MGSKRLHAPLRGGYTRTGMEGALPIIFLAVVLKIPVFFAIWLIWWASRSYDEFMDEAPGAEDHGFRRWRREPKRPSGPRRGPHGGAARATPDCPPGGRTRVSKRPVPALAAAARRTSEQG